MFTDEETELGLITREMCQDSSLMAEPYVAYYDVEDEEVVYCYERYRHAIDQFGIEFARERAVTERLVQRHPERYFPIPPLDRDREIELLEQFLENAADRYPDAHFDGSFGRFRSNNPEAASSFRHYLQDVMEAEAVEFIRCIRLESRARSATSV
jgi:hypothetical protein